MAQNTNVKTSRGVSLDGKLRIDRNKKNRIARHKRASLMQPLRIRRRREDRRATDWDVVRQAREVQRRKREEVFSVKSLQIDDIKANLRRGSVIVAAILP